MTEKNETAPWIERIQNMIRKASKKKMLLTSILILAVWLQPVKSSGITVFFDDFIGNSLSSGWNVEKTASGGDYSLNNGILTLSSSTSDPYASVTVYRDFIPQSDNFIVSARVKSRMLRAFALRVHASSLPIFGSIEGAQLEFDDGIEDKHFMAVWKPTGGGWYWTNIYTPVTTEAWFILELKVQRNPFTITFNVYNDLRALLGTKAVTNIGFSYNNIRYMCLHAWGSPFIYEVDWLKIEEAEVPYPPSVPEFPVGTEIASYLGIGVLVLYLLLKQQLHSKVSIREK